MWDLKSSTMFVFWHRRPPWATSVETTTLVLHFPSNRLLGQGGLFDVKNRVRIKWQHFPPSLPGTFLFSLVIRHAITYRIAICRYYFSLEAEISKLWVCHPALSWTGLEGGWEAGVLSMLGSLHHGVTMRWGSHPTSINTQLLSGFLICAPTALLEQRSWWYSIHPLRRNPRPIQWGPHVTQWG